MDDDVVSEVLLRLPPDEPEHLFRAALVCKPWLRILCDPGFLRRYRAFHGAPPLLGLLHSLQVMQGRPAPRFASTTSMPAFPYPSSHGRGTSPVDCRHGRVLVHVHGGMDHLVWDPVTGDRHAVPGPGIDPLIETAAVFCAAPGCDHLHCHGGPFRVAFVATDDREEIVKATVYSSETGAWSTTVSLGDECETYVQHRRDAIQDRRYYIPYVQPMRGAVIGDDAYFVIRRANSIVKYEWGKNHLSMIGPPSPDPYNNIALMVMDDGSLGCACIQGSSLYVWSRKVDSKGAAEWVQCRVIKLETIIPVANPGDKSSVPGPDIFNPDNLPFVAGSAEGVGVIFVSTGLGLFTVKLSSGQIKKVEEPGVYYSVLPYMSFYTPADDGTLLSLARVH